MQQKSMIHTLAESEDTLKHCIVLIEQKSMS